MAVGLHVVALALSGSAALVVVVAVVVVVVDWWPLGPLPLLTLSW